MRDAEQGAFARVDVFGHQRLQLLRQLNRGGYRVNAGVRQRGVGAAPVHRDPPHVAAGHQRAVVERKRTHRTFSHVVQGEYRVTRKTLKQAFLDHLQRTRLAHFFGRLKDEVHRAVELAMLRHVPGRRQQHGGVAVVPTGVHAAIMGRAVGKVVVFLQGQGIQVGP